MTADSNHAATETTQPVDESDRADHEPTLTEQRERSAKAFDQLLAQAAANSDSKRNKGDYLEALVEQWLRHDSMNRDRFDRVYLWHDWPGNGGRIDTGIDLIAESDSGEVCAIQCKFFAPGKRIQKGDVDSFLGESGKHPFTSRMYVETSGAAWGPNADKAIEDQRIPVQRVGAPDLRNSDIDWTTYSLARPDVDAGTQAKKQLRPHQTEALIDVMDGLVSNPRGQLVMACGTGKTYTSLRIAETLADELGRGARVLFLVPSLALMSQSLREWSRDATTPIKFWSVCSDVKVNRRKNAGDLADIAVVDLQVPPTTDPAKLAQSVEEAGEPEGLQVIFATYQSIGIVHEAQEIAGDKWCDFDLIICDEAHRTTGVTLSGEDESNFVRVHDADYLRGTRRLYMTATPRIFNTAVKDAATKKEAVLSSMDDEKTFGPRLHTLTFGKAVEKKLLTDYKVVVLGVSEDKMADFVQDSSADGGTELALDEKAKLVGVWNALSKRKAGTPNDAYGEDKTPMRRAVAFTSNIKTSKRITAEFPYLVEERLVDRDNDDPTDDLAVQIQHVDGTMNATTREELLDWLKEDVDADKPTARILSNARCLTEGVDVPSLDAVLFLNPRNSQIDVIQAVGRVMRKSEGKELGYVVLPIAVPVGVTPEQALNDNQKFKIVWQVLQALRAHDERLDAEINKIEYNSTHPASIIVGFVDFEKHEPKGKGDPVGGGAGEGTDRNGSEGKGKEPTSVQGEFNLHGVDGWKDSVYARIVKKVGSREYWKDWAKDIAEIAGRYQALIERLVEMPEHRQVFEDFVSELREVLNPSIDEAQAIEMLSQHIITKPLFDAMFPDQTFTSQNPVSRAMQDVLDVLAESAFFEAEREPLEDFYATMTAKIRDLDSSRGKQQMLANLYKNFFKKAFPKLAKRLGIVFTPVEVVDFILHSANDVLQQHFGKSLGDEGVSILEPFLGTGTFIVRLLQSGLISPDQLEYKYFNEIFGNEIVLLSYYIASVNIEAAYRELRAEQGHEEEGYVEFPGIVLTDTFQLHESDDALDDDNAFGENLARAEREKEAPIKVIVMNPPYSVGQKSANDNNQNLRYPALDTKIRNTYAKESVKKNPKSLYDSYLRAIRWASDRVGTEGVIAFVSNNAFLEGGTTDGMRKTLGREFSKIMVYDLKGYAYTQGERRKREGGNVFGEGSRTGIAVTVLVKDQSTTEVADVSYTAIDDYLTQDQKLAVLAQYRTITRVPLEPIEPNEHGDWLTNRSTIFEGLSPIGDEETKAGRASSGMFRLYSGGLKTNRDAWAYNFSHSDVSANMKRMVDNYNAEVAATSTSSPSNDPKRISWNRQLRKDFTRAKQHRFNAGNIVRSAYRPFVREWSYFDRALNDMVYLLPKEFPTGKHPNLTISLTGTDSSREFGSLLTDSIPDFHLLGSVVSTQTFPLYTWHKIDREQDLLSQLDADPDFPGVFDFTRSIGDQVPKNIDGYERRDNILDSTLTSYRDEYQDQSITKEDIFFYTYALLHSPEYRDRFESDLKKMLPRIPRVKGVEKFRAMVEAGKSLADVHVNYERMEPAGVAEVLSVTAPEDLWRRYAVTDKKMKFDEKSGALKYNDCLSLQLPKDINDGYSVGGRSPIEWVIDRYYIRTHKESGIVNDPNAWSRQVGSPRYIVDLIRKLVTVTQVSNEIISRLPSLDFDAGNAGRAE